MFYTGRDRQRMSFLKINLLERYLRATGWTPDEPADGKRHRSWEKLGFFIETPTWEGFADYGRRIGDVVQTLAHVEDRYPDAILDDLRDTSRERPILFSEPMIHALLAGIKTQTRRVMKPQPVLDGGQWKRGEFVWWQENRNPIDVYDNGPIKPCPFGKVGDRLWVREKWRLMNVSPHQTNIQYLASLGKDGDRVPWKSAIHMPREASRIVLEITKIKAERLHDITEADALAEGMAGLMRGTTRWEGEARDLFREVWEGIHGAASWEANPWVWAIHFQRTKSD